jgi:ribosome recycling factor
LCGHFGVDGGRCLGVGAVLRVDIVCGGGRRCRVLGHSEERRKELTKLVRNEGEASKVAVRNLRRDANESVKKLVKDKLASEDDQKRAEADIQKVTDKHIAEIDQLIAAKEQEIMAV